MILVLGGTNQEHRDLICKNVSLLHRLLVNHQDHSLIQFFQRSAQFFRPKGAKVVKFDVVTQSKYQPFSSSEYLPQKKSYVDSNSSLWSNQRINNIANPQLTKP